MTTYKYFPNVVFDTPIEDIKKQFHHMAVKLHPDCGGSEAEFIELKREYDDLLKHHQVYHRAANGSTYEKEPEEYEKPGEFAAIIDALIKMDGIEFELVGVWLWVFGDTKAHKDELKALGLRWNGKRQKWYKAPSDKRKRGRMSRKSYDELREIYGVQASGRGSNSGLAVA